MKRKHYGQYFIGAKRSDDKMFYHLKEGSPQELSTFINVVHRDCFDVVFPNDWIYEQIMDAFEELAENDLDDIELRSDDYTHDLLAWLQNSYALEEINECRQELGQENLKILDQIGWGQWYAKKKIYEAVNEFIEQDNEEESND